MEIFVLLAAAPAAEMVSEGLRRLPALRLAGWLRRGLEGLARFHAGMERGRRRAALALASAAAVLALAALLYAPQSPSACRAAYDPKSFPVAAAGQLEKAGLFGGVFTEDLWGGYLIYREYPRGRVFIDGRSDFYGAGVRRQVYQGHGRAGGLGAVSGPLRRGDRAVAAGCAVGRRAAQSGAWHLVYDDGVA